MTEAQHRDLAGGRWWTLSLFEQLGNVGSEISRTIRWTSRNPDLARSAFYRALELLDLTLADPAHRSSKARLREIARTREVVVDFFAGSNQYGSTAASLQKYFDDYALAHRARPAASVAANLTGR
ncbi:MAG: hypothetical protein ABI565_13275 [Vicinamibacteria bacterium]